MKKLFIYLSALLCFLSCIKEGNDGADLKVGDRLPDFYVTTDAGAEITGSFLREGVSCVVFFTTTCPDCQQTLPHLQRIYDEYLSKGVKFAIISRQEGAESLAAYWARQGFTMPYSAQEDRSIYELFARTGVPRVYISKDGVIRNIFTDSPTPTYDSLKEAIGDLKDILNFENQNNN